MTRPASVVQTLKATEMCRFAKGSSPLTRVGRQPIALFFALIVLPLCAVNAKAQLSIEVMEKNRRRVTLPTTEVTRIPGATRRAPEPITAIPLGLEVGDVLVGNTGLVAVKVRCRRAEASFSGKFRVRMLPSPPTECNLYFEGSAGARMSVRAGGPTRVVSGAFTLGTTRTIYDLVFSETKRRDFFSVLSRVAPRPKVEVFAGTAMINSPGFSGEVEPGHKVLPDVSGAAAIQELAPTDYLDAAKFQAGLDISQVDGQTVEVSAIYLRLGDKSRPEVEALAADLVQRARAGSDFCTLAERFSEPPAGAPGRCKAGSFWLNGLPPEVANAIKNMPVGSVSDPVRTAEGYQILRVDARQPMTAAQLAEKYVELLHLHRAFLEDQNAATLTALTRTQQALGIPPSDPGGQPSPSAGAIKVSLKPNEKLLVGFPSPVNECKSVVTFRLRVNNTS
ncbi:MAG: peptidylprolyl isomerase, partial [Pyrinomonadaceae bacterium]